MSKPMILHDMDTPAQLAERFGEPAACWAFGDSLLAADARASGARVRHGWVTYLEQAAIREATQGEATP